MFKKPPPTSREIHKDKIYWLILLFLVLNSGKSHKTWLKFDYVRKVVYTDQKAKTILKIKTLSHPAGKNDNRAMSHITVLISTLVGQ